MSTDPAIDAYLDAAPAPSQPLLRELCALIRRCAPGANERMAYGMPTWKGQQNLVHIAGYERHVGLYPTPSAIQTFADELTRYKTSKGAIQLPVDEPLPVELVERIVTFRVAEDAARAAAKKRKP